MAKITRRTGTTDRMGAVIGAIFCGVFMFVGFFIPTSQPDFFGTSPEISWGGSAEIWLDETGQVISTSSGGSFDIFSAFRIGWILICGALCIFCIYIALKGEGIPTETIDIESNGDPLVQVVSAGAGSAEKQNTVDFEQRLRRLEKLRADGLITEEEFREKRKQILSEKW